jgi:hypothetical protein
MMLPATAINSSANPWVFVAWFGCLCGAYIFGQGLLLSRRRGRTSVLTKIRAARPGPILVGGSAEGAMTLHAIFSGKPCFYYRTAVWRQEDPAREDSWENVAEETQGKPFILNDRSGCILVDPRSAVIDLQRDTYEEYGKTLLATGTDVPPALEQFLERNKIDTSAALRVEEYLIPPGAEIFVQGCAAANPDLPVAGTPPRQKKVTPRDGAGKDPASPTKFALSQIIHLSPEPPVTPAAEMTMQSRVAAALALARAQSSDTTVQNPLHIPSISVAVAEAGAGNLKPRSEEKIHDKQEQQQPGIMASAAQTDRPQPPLVLRQQDGSRFAISYRSPSGEGASSVRRAAALLLAGPLITLASAYFLLTNLGWL